MTKILFPSFLFMLILTVGCSRNPPVIKAERSVMGTLAAITIVDRNQEMARESIQAAFAEIVRIENRISTFQSASDAAKLNREKKISSPSNDFKWIMNKAMEYGQLSGELLI